MSIEMSPTESINPRYLSGVSDEPKQLSEPITGYAKEPLVSLEEACEPLLDLVPHLSAHIWIAKRNCALPADGLTQDESAAIHLYTMEWDAGLNDSCRSLYSYLNRTLKLTDRAKLRPWFRYLKLLLTALVKIPAAPRQTVWRGVRHNESENYPPDTQVTWWAFSSCTTSLSVLESDLYLGNSGTRTLFSIETFNGRTIRAHSHFQTEDEILLLPGTFLQVKSRLNPAPDLYIVHLCQKRPPYDLLDPPFPGAHMFPPEEPIYDLELRMRADSDLREKDSRPWYKRKRILIAILGVLSAIILTVVLASVLSRRSQTNNVITITTTTTLGPLLGGVIPDPISVADAFYSFDGNTLDLYSRRPGTVMGGPVTYVQGYVATGSAIVFDQSIAAYVWISSGFNLTQNTDLTVEGFFMLKRTQLNATLLQLTSNFAFVLTNGLLGIASGSNLLLKGISVLSTNEWHHLSFTRDGTQNMLTIYIDGSIDSTGSLTSSQMIFNKTNTSMIVGMNYWGYIDQLAISLKVKSAGFLEWDATVAAYYPLDLDWYRDKGPNGLNATGSGVTSIFGWLNDAIAFNQTSSFFQAYGFTALGTALKQFSIALWVRIDSQPGVFLTVSNPYTCLLVLGLQNNTNQLVAFVPNATVDGQSRNIIGPLMPMHAWVHVAFTWSVTSRAQLYTSGYLQQTDPLVTTLNNARGGNASSPMTITLGQYQGAANCQGIEGIGPSQRFIGSLDEVYIFSTELSIHQINQLLTPPST